MFIFLLKGAFAGLAANGFAILFNVPARSLFPIWVLGFIGGSVKYFLLSSGFGILSSSFIAASLIGILSIPVARNWYSPPLVFSIAAVIPMVPGAFAYNMMLGILDLALSKHGDKLKLIISVAENASTLVLVLSALAFGVSLPVLISRRQSVRHIEHHR